MNITVYCGANAGNNPRFAETAKTLGTWIATNEHTLIYGGGKVGLMGIVADEVLLHNGQAIGVIPTFLADRELGHPHITHLEIVHSMSERKNRMIELGDVYIALPGGPGTLEEIIEVISWARIGQHDNPCILLNVDGYYDDLLNLFDKMVANEFLTEEHAQLIVVVDSVEALEGILQGK
ncbi:MAG: TIGR00730 family Rossman fold protein [Solibacillus sp.]